MILAHNNLVRTNMRPRASMPDEGVLLWRSPDGAMGLCILTNLHGKHMASHEYRCITFAHYPVLLFSHGVLILISRF